MNSLYLTEMKMLSSEQIGDLFTQIIKWGMSFVGSLVLALIVWFVGKKLIKFANTFFLKILKKSDLDEGVIKFILSLFRFAAYAVLIITIIDILGFETTSLLTIIGSAGLAFGLALQGSLSNFAGGILILLFKPFKVGDYIIACGHEGNVVTIELLYTKLLTVDNKTIMIPNGTLANAEITNVACQKERRIDIQIGIAYSADLKKAKEILQEILNSTDALIKEKEILVVVKSLDESCVTLETRSWVNTPDYWSTRFKLLEEIKLVFDEKGIEIPFNQLDVNIKNQ